MAVLLFVHIAILKGTWLQVEQTNLMKWSKGSGTGECGSWISEVSARSCQHRGWCSSRVWYPRNSGWGKCTCSLSLACSLSVNSMIYMGRETHHSCLDHIAIDLKLIEFRSDMLPYPIESHPSFQYDTNMFVHNYPVGVVAVSTYIWTWTCDRATDSTCCLTVCNVSFNLKLWQFRALRGMTLPFRSVLTPGLGILVLDLKVW